MSDVFGTSLNDNPEKRLNSNTALVLFGPDREAAIRAIGSYDTLAQQNEALRAALTEISNMCIGEIAMSYKLDAACIGDLIYDATGMTNPELNKALESAK